MSTLWIDDIQESNIIIIVIIISGFCLVIQAEFLTLAEYGKRLKVVWEPFANTGEEG